MDDIITHLNQDFGVRDPLTVSDGQVHDYLGMIFDYSVLGKLFINMTDYINTVLKEACILQGVPPT